MWIERPERKTKFINDLNALQKQVLLVHGARQVGKTAFISNAFQELADSPQLKLNLLYPSSFTIDGVEYLGRDFFGRSPTGEEFLKNCERKLGGFAKLERPAFIFVDEVDRYPKALEAIQALAGFSDKLKCVFTGSNLENLPVENVATGRRKYFDLYPITFREFALARDEHALVDYLDAFSFAQGAHTEFMHNRLRELFLIYIRIGGMPRIVDAYLDPKASTQSIEEIIKDLAVSIEENVKTVLGEKANLYDYEDVLRKLAQLSMNSLKFTNLQVQHAGRSEAKRLVNKTVGARVAHKIRLIDAQRDLSRYIIFDCGVLNYLLSGADLLNSTMGERELAILLETFVGLELAAHMITRDDLLYWKSGNKAELEYVLRSPRFTGIDVKTGRGDIKSLSSFALFEADAACIVKIGDEAPRIDREHEVKLPNYSGQRKVAFMTIPHYLTYRLPELLEGI